MEKTGCVILYITYHGHTGRVLVCVLLLYMYVKNYTKTHNNSWIVIKDVICPKQNILHFLNIT